jgi:NADH-quinone oxidoreductase subunit E
MARLSKENVRRAQEAIALYPKPRSAIIPLLHLAQEQDGYLTIDAMEHVAELLDLKPAEVYGTASFYDMLFTQPVGKYVVSICTNIACMLWGAYELLEHAESMLGVKAGGTTRDGMFTLEDVECIALCGNAPCLTVNWRFFGDVDDESFDTLIADLRAGRLDDVVPPHGTLCRVRRAVGLLAGDPGRGQAEEPETPAEAAVPRGPASGVPSGDEVEPTDELSVEAIRGEVGKVGDGGESGPESGSEDQE